MIDGLSKKLPESVLFACTMNTVRSAIAEGILKHFHGDKIFVDSAGLTAGDKNGYMIEVMAEIGIDLSKHSSKTISSLQDTSFDLIITFRRSELSACHSPTSLRFKVESSESSR